MFAASANIAATITSLIARTSPQGRVDERPGAYGMEQRVGGSAEHDERGAGSGKDRVVGKRRASACGIVAGPPDADGERGKAAGPRRCGEHVDGVRDDHGSVISTSLRGVPDPSLADEKRRADGQHRRRRKPLPERQEGSDKQRC